MGALSLTLVAIVAGGSPTAQTRAEPVPPATEVAITVDDLPRHAKGALGPTPVQVAKALLAAFERHRVPQVYGFINGARLDAHPNDREVLERWVTAGHPLGNHAWAHEDLHSVQPAGFLQAVARNEPLLAALQPTSSRWKTFRYPYLREGADVNVRGEVRSTLLKQGYRVAPVTIDPFDWSYEDAYRRCSAQQANAMTAALRAAFLAESRGMLHWARAQATNVLGRPLRHILVIHLSAIAADALPQLLEEYERLGVRWISLDDALADPAYQEDPRVPKGGNFLNQLLEARGKPHSPKPRTSQELLDALCPVNAPPATPEKTLPP